MIQVDVITRGDAIVDINVTGHAMTGAPGKDLVCAGVSSIMVGALNGFDALASNDVTLKMTEDPCVQITIHTPTKDNQLLCQFLINQLETIMYMHSDALNINKKEEQS